MLPKTDITFFEEHYGTSRIGEFFPNEKLDSKFFDENNVWVKLARMLDVRGGIFPPNTKFILRDTSTLELENKLLHLRVMLKSSHQLQDRVKQRIPSVAYLLNHWFANILV